MSTPGSRQRLHLPGRAIALVLAGGCDSDVLPDGRSAAATHFGGRFRTVDFSLSNCLNSGIRRIGVVTPASSHSLQRHLKRSWGFLKGDDSEFIRSLAGSRRAEGEPVPSSAFALLAQQRQAIADSGAQFVLVLSGDRIYKMNYAVMLADHVAKGRAVTVACIDLPAEAVRGQMMLAADTQGRVTHWGDQPTQESIAPAPPGNPERALVSMGIHVFNAPYLLAELARDHSDLPDGADAGSNLMARAVRSGQASAHPFALSCVRPGAAAMPYWCDVGTIDAYWDANIDLTASLPQLDLYDPNWPMRAQQAELAPAKFLHNQADRRGMAVESLVSGGSIISGSVLRSVLFSAVRVHSYASVEWSVLLPAVRVGRHARLRRVVVESGCDIPDGLVVGEDAVADAARFLRTDRGITLITAERIAQLARATPELAADQTPGPPLTDTALR